MKIIIASILFSFCLFGFDNASASDQECPDEDVSVAATSARNLSNWEMVYYYFRKYQNCADSSIVEYATDSIQDLWVNHWPEIPKMIYYTSRDRSFKDFIWQRIGDDSFIEEDFNAFVLNAQEKCPDKALEFCREVVSVAYKYLLIKPVIKQDRS
jgi:hypothetical protein